jgi:ActR/RegA family two-component response regulator
MAQILFVDDEPGIRETLPRILEMHGHQVVVAANVAEALSALHFMPFEVLIADLNIGQPGDGFTVVSAMRRTHPGCVNIILTGYPAFETALQAIREQVDDYWVKPADISKVLSSIQELLASRTPPRVHRIQPISKIIRTHKDAIVQRTLTAMKAHPQLGKLSLSDAERTDHIPPLLEEFASQLESHPSGNAGANLMPSAAEHGKTRRHQDYPLTGIIADASLLQRAIYETVQEHLLSVDLSQLLIDLQRINEALDERLQQSLAAFLATELQAA